MMTTAASSASPAVHDTPALSSALRDAAKGSRVAVADARFGTWTPHSIATQWIGQIVGQDIALKNDAPPIASLMSLGDAMCAGIDEEGKGNRALLSAFGTARQLATLLARRPCGLILLAPVMGFDWLADATLFLGYLEEMVPETRVTILTGESPVPCERGDEAGAAAQDSPVPRAIRANSLAAAIPSAMSPRTVSLFGEAEKRDLLILENGWAIAAPESRGGDAWLFSAADIARLGPLGLGALRGFATYYSASETCGAWQCCVDAWRICHAGPRELAPMLMDQAVERAAAGGERETLRAQRQALRIATSNYPVAAAELPPEPQADPATAGFIEQTRGWGLVMIGQPAAAHAALRRALALRPVGPPARADLLLMNIAALAELRAGYPDEAMALEKQIELGLESIPGAEELRFVNSINQARLYRYQQDFDRARTYYEHAFTTTKGGRTETDHVNVELCLARLEMARGDNPAAFLHWVRAAMQWCANACPEALNWRVQMLVIDKGWQIALTNHADAQALVERLAGGFLNQLQQLAAALDLAVDVDPNHAFPFFVSDAVRVQARPRALGGAGWSVLAATVDDAPRPSGARLRALWAWLTAFIHRTVLGAAGNCFLIDRRDGSDMPTDWEAVLASAVDHDAAAIDFDGRHAMIDASWAADAQQRRALGLNPFVARIEEDGERPLVHFRRYANAFTPSPSQHELIVAAQRGVSLGEALHGRDELAADLTMLRRQRIVRLAELALDDAQSFDSKSVSPQPVARAAARGPALSADTLLDSMIGRG